MSEPMTWIDEQRALIARRLHNVAPKMQAGQGSLAERLLLAARFTASEAPRGLRVMVLDIGIVEAMAALRNQGDAL